MAFQIHGLDPALFAPWFALSDAELVARGARRVFADSSVGHPCRVSLEDAELGEELLLVNHEHHATSSPYRAAGPIYIRRAANQQVVLDHVPDLLASRVLSVRGYDADGMMQAVELIDGRELGATLERMLDVAAYVHVHYAKPGCFACRVTR